MSSQGRIHCSCRGMMVWLFLVLLFSPTAWGQSETENSVGSTVLLDFDDASQISHLRLGKHTTAEFQSESRHSGEGAAKIIYSAVPDGTRDFPAVIVEN